MGFWRGTSKAASSIMSFRFDKWVDYQNIKQTLNIITRDTKVMFTPTQPNRIETFEQALERLNLDESSLKDILKQYTFFLILYLFLSLTIFSYGIFIALVKNNYWGFIVSFSLTTYSLSRAFYYHFWLFQINQKRLGCSFKDWSSYYLH